jgi:hypothetical protein
VPEGRSQRIHHALRELSRLTPEEREAIVRLDLPVYDSLVLGYLKDAARLLADDEAFAVMERDRAWALWWQGMQAALRGALRLRENEPLVMALAVVGALLPGVYPRASLRGFKALEDALLEAQRTSLSPKRERAERRQRVQDRIRRVSVWMSPSNVVWPGAEPPPPDPARRSYREVWGATFTHARARDIVRLVHAVLPVTSHPSDGGTLVVPLPGGDAS